MTNMKMEAKRVEKEIPVLAEKPDYPYGLCIALDDDSIRRLGIKEMPAIGETLMLYAIVKVTALSENDNGNNISLQITDMELKASKEEKTDSEAFYGGDKENRPPMYVEGF